MSFVLRKSIILHRGKNSLHSPQAYQLYYTHVALAQVHEATCLITM